jgi:quinone-modifying oxidoreductase subunit QmoC
LLSNAARMAAYVIRQGPDIPAAAYLIEFKELVMQGLTQKRWRECASGASARHWLRHFLLVTAYVTMFSLVVVFLYWFQVEDASFQWTSLLGYYSTLILLSTTLWIVRDRMQKKEQMHKYSDLADWLFVILLFILLHLARLLNLAMPTYWLYVIHLMIAVPMLVVEVPFGKWSHMLYRPLALYLMAVERRWRHPVSAHLVVAA